MANLFGNDLIRATTLSLLRSGLQCDANTAYLWQLECQKHHHQQKQYQSTSETIATNTATTILTINTSGRGQ